MLKLVMGKTHKQEIRSLWGIIDQLSVKENAAP
jgi:hypothetical protein